MNEHLENIVARMAWGVEKAHTLENISNDICLI